MKHGHATGDGRSPEYETWCRLRARCENPNIPAFPDYGGRGIQVCERWRESFSAFLQDVGPKPGARYSLDRIDNDGDYEPGNVRWANDIQQANNRRSNTMVTHGDETLTIANWARRLGISALLIAGRLRQGLTVEQALTPGDLRKLRKAS